MQEKTRQYNRFVDSVDVADDAQDRLADFLFGVEDDAGYLPMLAVDRLYRHFGDGDPIEQIGRMRESLVLFTSREQNDLLLYFSGFPNSALYRLGSDQLDASLQKLLIVYRELGYSQDSMAYTSLDSHFEKEDIIQRTRTSGELAKRALAPDNLNRAAALDSGWENYASCASHDPSVFEVQDETAVTFAKAICKECPVAWSCLLVALENNEGHGTWGGMSSDERKSLPSVQRKKMIKLLQSVV